MKPMKTKKSKDYITVMMAARLSVCRELSIAEDVVAKWPIGKICKALGLRFADGSTPKGTREIKTALHYWEKSRSKVVILPPDNWSEAARKDAKSHTERTDRQLMISAASQATDLARLRGKALHKWVNSPAFLTSREWLQVRDQALRLWGHACQRCGASRSDGAVICGDHIKPRKLFPQLALELSNIQVLCAPCNWEKGNWDHTDWRPTPQEFEAAADRAFQEVMALAKVAYGQTNTPHQQQPVVHYGP